MGLAMPSLALGQAASPVGRLQWAISASRELAMAAEELTPDKNEPVRAVAKEDREDISQRRFPRQSHVSQYTKARPWTLAYDRFSFREGMKELPQAWPAPADRSELRGLLKDGDPALRGMAAEALATLYEPEDLPLLAGLLSDTAEAAPNLGYNMALSSRASFEPPGGDGLTVLRSWYKRTVASYAREGLKLISAREFTDEAEFRKWWKNNENARHCLWYWQQRIQRGMDEIEHDPGTRSEQGDHRKQVAAAKAALARTVLAELKQLPPEVEAKVRLLTTSERAGGAPITGSENSFWPEPPALRVTPKRLLDLLDRKNLWQDVAWDKEHYNLLAERLGIWAAALFLPEHAPGLHAALKRERNTLWWSGQAALIIGISRLMPAAKDDALDQAGTRDWMLRDAVLHEPDLFVRDYCAMELVRIGLPGNAAFLKRIAFEPIKDNGSPTLSQAILQALAEKPLTVAKRELLADIVLDERFKIFWTRPNARMGDDMDREYAAAAINAHAGRLLITDEQKDALVNPARSAGALKKLRASVEQPAPP